MTTSRWKFKSALCEGTWIDEPVITIFDGCIKAIETDVEADREFDLVVLPGMVNVHSHAFQRGFAGLSEYRTAEKDSFWTWRNLMYQFVAKLDPEDAFVIAKQLYLEMLAAGYTWVGEFHYLHNQKDGSAYPDLSTMSDSIDRAAEEVGIGLCHLPVLYQRGGFENEPLVEGQNRFALETNQMIELIQSCEKKFSHQFNKKVGLAIHSLRAADPKIANEVIQELSKDVNPLSIHIHVAEQQKEISDSLRSNGMRSVQYLFDQFPVDERWCLIHATHLDDDEVKSIIQSKATVGLCPTTEANLGDGFFRATEFLSGNGRIAVGSDSHCSVDWREELRTLEYGQRLKTESRALLGDETRSVGRRLYQAAAEGGAQAIGVSSGNIAVGLRADFTLIDPMSPAIGGEKNDRLIDRSIFTNVGNPVAGVVIGGRLILTHNDEFRERLATSTRAFIEVNNKLAKTL